MRLAQFKLLTDENVNRVVVTLLRQRGFDVLDVAEEGLLGASDVELLRRAVSEDRVVVTHDRDFGTLAILRGEPVVGIVYVRPGHIAQNSPWRQSMPPQMRCMTFYHLSFWSCKERAAM